MKTTMTAVDRDYHGLPIVRPDFTAAGRIAATTADASHTAALEPGAYLITPKSGIFLSIGTDAVASDAAGSIYVAGGTPYHTLVRPGERLSILASDEDGPVFYAPLI